MKKVALTALALLTLLLGSGCGSSTPQQRSGQERGTVAPINYDTMRDKVVLGLAKAFRASTPAGPARFGLCVRLGMRRVLTPTQLDRLLAIHHRPGGQQLAAQALNALAAPIGASCGGARYVPELVAAAEALDGDYPLSRLGLAARRLGVTYGPYLGISCRRPGSTDCDRVGVDVVLHRDARSVSVSLGGRRLILRTPGLHTGRAGRDWVGYLDRAGLERPDSPFFVPTHDQGAPGWAGSRSAVYLPVRLKITYPDETTAAGTLPHVLLSPGWG
ncbi:MAG: hypothetical protein ABW065_03470 [Solirubrobacterales bacterium]